MHRRYELLQPRTPDQKGAQEPIKDYERARAIFDTLFASHSFHLDLDLVMLLGY